MGAALMAGVAATHVLEARLEDVRYVVVLFALLTAASLVVSALLLLGRALSVAWPAAALLCATAIAGYLLSRTVGLPQMPDDVSNWTEPFGIAALACEAGVMALVLQKSLEVA